MYSITMNNAQPCCLLEAWKAYKAE